MKHYPLITAGALFAALTLTACGRQDDPQTAGQKVDEAVATAERKTEEMKADANRGLESAKSSADQAAQDIKSSTGQAMDKAANAVSDAAITASVNAELAKDEKLSALRINVDTVGGKVALRGTAPDTASRERATQLAAAVEGVVSVDNQLKVGQG